MQTITQVSLWLYILISSSFLLHHLQIKEYRFDRFIDYLKYEQGYKKLFRLPNSVVYLVVFANLFIQNRVLLQICIILSLASALAYVFATGFYRFTPTKKAQIIYILNLVALYFVKDPNLIYLLSPITLIALVVLFMPLSRLGKERVIHKAKLKRDSMKDLTVVGITGSYGKSSTKEMLYELLKDKFCTLKTPKNINTDIGVARHLLANLKPEHQVYIVEMGAYRIGEIRNICKFTKPKIGILTAIAPQHISLFGSLQNIKVAKSELIQAVPEGGLAIINVDSLEAKDVADHTKVKTTTYTKSSEFKYKADLNAPFLYTNLHAATIAAKELGMTEAEIQKAITKLDESISPIKFRNGINQSQILDDSYNSNPQGFAEAIKLADKTKASGRKILLTRGMIELGEISDQEHEKIAHLAAQIFDEVIITKPEIKKPFAKNIQNLKYIKKTDELIHYLQNNLEHGDLLLIENRQPAIVINSIIQE